MTEIWKSIDHFEGLYEVSNLGHIRIVTKDEKTELLRKRHKKHGYLVVCLISKDKYYYANVHTLVARAFVKNPFHKKTVDHINGNKYDNRANNLRWATQYENNLYSVMKNPNHIRKWKMNRLKKKVEKGLSYK